MFAWFLYLDEEGKDGLSAFGVVLELLLVVAVLAQGPQSHLVCAGKAEQSSWNALGHDGEGDPGSDFIGVVGARDELEEDGERIEGGVWDLANLGSGRSQATKSPVNAEVSKFTQQEPGEASIHLFVGGCSVEGVVNVVGDVGRESPVVGGVLEEVGDGHGRVGESVDEDRFQKTLGIVESPATEGNLNDRLEVLVSGSFISVEDPRSGVNPEINEKWSGVLRQEYGGPADLESTILKVEHCPVLQLQILER